MKETMYAACSLSFRTLVIQHSLRTVAERYYPKSGKMILRRNKLTRTYMYGRTLHKCLKILSKRVVPKVEKLMVESRSQWDKMDTKTSKNVNVAE